MNDLPTELLGLPAPLIAVLSSSPVGEAVASALRVANASAQPLKYGNTPLTTPRARVETYPLGHAFARKLRTHTSEYESYAVNGVIRSTWLEKHHQRIPATAVLVFEFDPRLSSADWVAAENSVGTAIVQLRGEVVKERLLEAHVVFVQERSSAAAPRLPGTAAFAEDRALVEIATERIGALRRKAGLDGNCISLLYTTDVAPAAPGIVSLEALLRERASNFFTNHIRRWKRTVLPRLITVPMHLPLKVRVLFKIAQFQEFRARPHKALKYYSLAFATLQQIPRLASLLPELKTVAELLNFKVMHHYLMHGYNTVTTPAGVSGLSGAQAAVMQFQAHMRAMDGAVGDPASAWGHWAWVARQYVIAAELFQLNLPRPTADTRAQHVPAFYYHTAALYAIRRRKAAAAAGLVATYSGEGTWTPATAFAAGASAGALLPPLPWTPPPAPGAAAAAAESVGTLLLPPAHLGGRARVVPSAPASSAPAEAGGSAAVGGSGSLTPAEEVRLLGSHLRLTESRVPHVELALGLLERAQATMLRDGGTGAAGSGPHHHLPSGGGDPGTYAKGSCFSFSLAGEASRGRAWRQWLCGEELYAGGRVLDALRLLAPVAAFYKREGWTPLLTRVTQRVRECAALARDAPHFIAASIDLLSPALHSNSTNAGEVWEGLGAALGVRHSHPPPQLQLTGGPGLDIVLPRPSPVTPALLATVVGAAPAPVFFGGAAEPVANGNGNGSHTRPRRPRVLPLSRVLASPLPSQLAMTLRTPGAPLLSVLVAFSRRVAHRGALCAVRVILCSNLPRAVTFSALQVRFGTSPGDAACGMGTGGGVGGPARPESPSSGSPSAFDIVLEHGGDAAHQHPAGQVPGGLVRAAPPDGRNVQVIRLLGEEQGRTPGAPNGQQPRAVPRVLASLSVPAHGSVAFEYSVRVPMQAGLLPPPQPGVHAAPSSGTGPRSRATSRAGTTVQPHPDPAAPVGPGVHTHAVVTRARAQSLADRHSRDGDNGARLLASMARSCEGDPAAYPSCAALLYGAPGTLAAEAVGSSDGVLTLGSGAAARPPGAGAPLRSVDWSCTNATAMATAALVPVPPGIDTSTRVVTGRVVAAMAAVAAVAAAPLDKEAAATGAGTAAPSGEPEDAAWMETVSCVSAALTWRPEPGAAGGPGPGGELTFRITPTQLATEAGGGASVPGGRPAGPVAPAPRRLLPPISAHLARIGIARSAVQQPGYRPYFGEVDDEDAEKRRRKKAAADASAASARAAAAAARLGAVTAALRAQGFLADGVSSVHHTPEGELLAARGVGAHGTGGEPGEGGDEEEQEGEEGVENNGWMPMHSQFLRQRAAASAPTAAAPLTQRSSAPRYCSSLLLVAARPSARVVVSPLSPGSSTAGLGAGVIHANGGCFTAVRVTVEAGARHAIRGGVLVLEVHTPHGPTPHGAVGKGGAGAVPRSRGGSGAVSTGDEGGLAPLDTAPSSNSLLLDEVSLPVLRVETPLESGAPATTALLEGGAGALEDFFNGPPPDAVAVLSVQAAAAAAVSASSVVSAPLPAGPQPEGPAHPAPPAAAHSQTTMTTHPHVFVSGSVLLLRSDGTVSGALGAAPHAPNSPAGGRASFSEHPGGREPEHRGSGEFVCIDNRQGRHQPHPKGPAPAGATRPHIVGIAIPPLPAGVAFSTTVFVRCPPVRVPVIRVTGGEGDPEGRGAAAAASVRCALSAHLHYAQALGPTGPVPQLPGPPVWLPFVLGAPHAYRHAVCHQALVVQPPFALRVRVLPDPAHPLCDLTALLPSPRGSSAKPPLPTDSAMGHGLGDHEPPSSAASFSFSSSSFTTADDPELPHWTGSPQSAALKRGPGAGGAAHPHPRRQHPVAGFLPLGSRATVAVELLVLSRTALELRSVTFSPAAPSVQPSTAPLPEGTGASGLLLLTAPDAVGAAALRGAGNHSTDGAPTVWGTSPPGGGADDAPWTLGDVPGALSAALARAAAASAAALARDAPLLSGMTRAAEPLGSLPLEPGARVSLPIEVAGRRVGHWALGSLAIAWSAASQSHNPPTGGGEGDSAASAAAAAAATAAAKPLLAALPYIGVDAPPVSCSVTLLPNGAGEAGDPDAVALGAAASPLPLRLEVVLRNDTAHFKVLEVEVAGVEGAAPDGSPSTALATLLSGASGVSSVGAGGAVHGGSSARSLPLNSASTAAAATTPSFGSPYAPQPSSAQSAQQQLLQARSPAPVASPALTGAAANPFSLPQTSSSSAPSTPTGQSSSASAPLGRVAAANSAAAAAAALGRGPGGMMHSSSMSAFPVGALAAASAAALGSGTAGETAAAASSGMLQQFRLLPPPSGDPAVLGNRGTSGSAAPRLVTVELLPGAQRSLVWWCAAAHAGPVLVPLVAVRALDLPAASSTPGSSLGSASAMIPGIVSAAVLQTSTPVSVSPATRATRLQPPMFLAGADPATGRRRTVLV